MTGTEPSGAASNDIFLATIYLESTTVTPSPPPGWAQTFRSASCAITNSTAANQYQHLCYWIRRGGSAPSFAWTWSGTIFSSMNIVAYSGAVTTEQPWSFFNLTKRDDTTARTFPDTSGTTLTANELLTWNGTFFTSVITACQPPTSFTERNECETPAASGGSQIEIGDTAQAAAGGTGTVTGATWTGGSAATAASFLGGLKSVAEGAVTVIPLRTLLGVGL